MKDKCNKCSTRVCGALMLLGLLVLLGAYAPVMQGQPYAFDMRNLSLSCVGFVPNDQGSCNSCVAASLASALSIQACLMQGRNVLFSAQQIWDCYDGSCTNGVQLLMDDFFAGALVGLKAGIMLKSLSNATPVVMRASNYSLCTGEEGKDRLISVEEHRSGLLGNSTQRLQESLVKRGPALAIVGMNETAFAQFATLGPAVGRKPFVLGDEGGPVLHALTVIGWAPYQDAHAWLVLNSMGTAWGNQGVGFVVGPLQQQWYSFELLPQACDNAPCSGEKDQLFVTLPPSTAGDMGSDALVFLFTCLFMGVLSALFCSLENIKAGARLPRR